MINDPAAIFLTLAAVVFLAIKLEEKVPLFRALGAALTGILLGMLLSNTGILPGESPTYNFLMGDGVYFGIALILLNVNLRSVLEAGPGMLGAFGIGAAGTALGAVVGGLFLSGLIGPETWKLAGQYAGTYTGGGANFAAVGRAFENAAVDEDEAELVAGPGSVNRSLRQVRCGDVSHRDRVLCTRYQ